MAGIEEQTEDKNCILCGCYLEDYGNNPFPICEVGKCCNKCNIEIVIPERMKQIKEQKTLWQK